MSNATATSREYPKKPNRYFGKMGGGCEAIVETVKIFNENNKIGVKEGFCFSVGIENEQIGRQWPSIDTDNESCETCKRPISYASLVAKQCLAKLLQFSSIL